MSVLKLPLAVIFDMDGLIFDSEALSWRAFQAAAAECDLSISYSFFLNMIGRPSDANQRMFRDNISCALTPDEFWAVWRKQYDTMRPNQLFLKAGVLELLDLLDATRIRRAIATSSSPSSVQRNLEMHGLVRRFDVIVARGDYARGKPDPDPFLVAARRLGVLPKDCLALEDSHNGVRSATAAGMSTIMVPDLLPATDEMRTLCVSIVRDLHKVAAMFQK